MSPEVASEQRRASGDEDLEIVEMAEGKSSLACPRCSFVGKSVQSLKVHIGRAHGSKRRSRRTRGPAAGRRGTRCSACGQSFKTIAARKAHVTRFHGGAAGEGLSPLQQQLVGLAVGELADLYDACRAELRRRLTE
jgi:uncharacterized C2H2 Zn-finger protein